MARAAIFAAALAVCSTALAAPKADATRPPEKVTCIDLPAALSGLETRGWLKVEWETRLERGPYIAEWEDAEGTYFRAPPGGVYMGPPKDKPAKGAWQLNRDGGIFVPRDPSAPAQLYAYTQENGVSVATLVPPASANCANTQYVRDPGSQAVRVAGYIDQGTATSEKRVGVPGASVAGYLLDKMLTDVGKIVKLPQSANPQFNVQLNQSARAAVAAKAAATAQ